MYETDNGVWWQIAGFLAATAILITAVNWLLRKILGVERKKFFSAESNYVNAMHHKVNDYFRWGNVVLYLFLLIVYGFERGSLYFWWQRLSWAGCWNCSMHIWKESIPKTRMITSLPCCSFRRGL